MNFLQISKNKIASTPWRQWFNMYREPTVTYCITPNNAPEERYDEEYSRAFARREMMRKGAAESSSGADLFFNVLSGLYTKFYPPERIRFNKGVNVKLNDLVSYKVVYQNRTMKFYLTVPEKWSRSFINAIKKSWGEIDISKVEDGIIHFDYQKAKAAVVGLKHHYCLAIKHEKNESYLYPALSSIASTLDTDDKLLIDFNIQPTNEMWKPEASRGLKQFESGRIPRKKEKSIHGFIGILLDLGNSLFEEGLNLIEDLMSVQAGKADEERKWDLQYSKYKIYPNTKGYLVQIRAIAESDDSRKTKMMLKSVGGSFENLDGDNQFHTRFIKTKRGVKAVINATDKNKPLSSSARDVFYEKELEQLVRIPDKNTLKEYKDVIDQDNFTRTEIHNDFFESNHDAIPFATTLDKDPKVIHFAGYDREWWTNKGRRVKDKTKLDDRSTATMLWGSQGSGKTTMITRQAAHTFGLHLPEEEWKEKSKSVVLFDVADGEIVTNMWNIVPERLRNRVVILNHSNFNNPIPVNFSELEEFNREVMKDEDYAFKMAEMESNLVRDVLQSEKSLYVDRWFTTALQCAHMADKDWGYPEAIRILTDDEFRITEVMPKVKDERMTLEMEVYNEMRSDSKKSDQIIQTIQNRFIQLERDQKLWDCIGQKPRRNEDGSCMTNFRKWMDGDEDGAYLVLVYIPKDNVSEVYRKFLFAHYFTKIWNVALSRASGFAGREYRPETLVVFDEVHQIIDVPTVAELFIDLFKEPRKYSLRLMFSLHGWSSLAKAGRNFESKIKQSIMDNGCNLVMLRGGSDAFKSLQNFMGDITLSDYENLMNMKFCGIFAIRWQNKNHVFQGRLLPSVDAKPSEVGESFKHLLMKRHDDWDSNILSEYVSPYGREKAEVRGENLQRIRKMLKQSLLEDASSAGLQEGVSWEDIDVQGGMSEKR